MIHDKEKQWKRVGSLYLINHPKEGLHPAPATGLGQQWLYTIGKPWKAKKSTQGEIEPLNIAGGNGAAILGNNVAAPQKVTCKVIITINTIPRYAPKKMENTCSHENLYVLFISFLLL